VEAILKAGIARVVVGLLDPDVRVAGRGVERLRQAGLPVDIGLAAGACHDVLKGYLLRQTALRPFVTCKVAVTSNGVVASKIGDPRLVISSQPAQTFVHALRARHDAVVVGANTFVMDAPLLNVRLPGYSGRQPLKVVLDRSHQLGVQPSGWLRVCEAELVKSLRVLAEKGVTKILVEPGPQLAAAFMQNDLVDAVVLVRSSSVAEGVRGYRFEETFAKDTRWQLADELVLASDHVLFYSKQV
jgi:diaminohydroxyphosphoribosylaminopyrimidine deaminase/5-amino-6-(5-phosphoribosylamino)uracil reductase